MPWGVRGLELFTGTPAKPQTHSSTIGGAVGTFESLTKQVGVSVVGFSGLLIVNRPRDRFGSFRHVDNTSNPEDAGGDDRSDVPLELRLPDEPR